MSKTSAQQTGQNAEDSACTYLVKQGLKLITRNYQCRLGEIDLIMQDKESLVFVEVRFRRKQNFGTSSETVNYFKQKKLLRTARFYLQQKRLTDKVPCRFDVIAIADEATHANIDWIKNAFSA
jgi:putative endonuclease